MKTYKDALLFMEDKEYIEAKETFDALGDYKDSKKLAIECVNRDAYEKAKTLLSIGNYVEAKEAFEALGDYKDSKKLAGSCFETAYSSALSYMNKKNYEAAKAILSDISSYKDSTDLLTQCGDYELQEAYNKALTAYKDKKYYTAYQLFTELGDYSDSKKKVKACSQSYPGTKVLYRNNKYSFSYAPLLVHTGDGVPTFLKIYTTDNKLVATVFINEGDSIDFDMPSGNYIVKEANGSIWYGEKEMFGKEGYYYQLDTELEFNSWGLGYEITLYTVEGGNLGLNPASNNGF